MPATAALAQKASDFHQPDLSLYLFNMLAQQKMKHVIDHYDQSGRVKINKSFFPKMNFASDNIQLSTDLGDYFQKLYFKKLPTASFNEWSNTFYEIGKIHSSNGALETANAYWKLAIIFDPYKNDSPQLNSREITELLNQDCIQLNFDKHDCNLTFAVKIDNE
jgi:hypothetical protein